jgi:hypothetical protein
MLKFLHAQFYSFSRRLLIFITITLFAIISILVLTSCHIRSKSFWKEEKTKVETCQNLWAYEDLPESQLITALLFNAKWNHDVSSFPNFLIGVTKNNDTLAIMDKNFEGNIKHGDIVTVVPERWSQVEKDIKKPLFTVNPRSDENDLYCAVRTIYYGKIEMSVEGH